MGIGLSAQGVNLNRLPGKLLLLLLITGQESFLCVIEALPVVPTESSQDKGNFLVRSRPEENHPEWKPALSWIYCCIHHFNFYY